MRTKKSWVLSKGQCKMTICKSSKDGKSFSGKGSKKVILTSSFDKNNLGEELFALGKEIHRNKKKRVSGLSQRAYLEKSSKRYIVCMRIKLHLSYCQG